MGGKNRGRLYGAADMSSHFSHGATTTFYVTQSSARGRPTSSDSDLQRVIDDLQRKAEEWEKAHQEELQCVLQAQEQFQLDMQQNMSEMMQCLSAMEARHQNADTGSSRQQLPHPDYVENDEEDEADGTPMRFSRRHS